MSIITHSQSLSNGANVISAYSSEYDNNNYVAVTIDYSYFYARIANALEDISNTLITISETGSGILSTLQDISNTQQEISNTEKDISNTHSALQDDVHTLRIRGSTRTRGIYVRNIMRNEDQALMNIAIEQSGLGPQYNQAMSSMNNTEE